MTHFPVSISLGSFGADLVRQRGQASFIQPLLLAGAQYIELREELFVTPPDLVDLGREIAGAGLRCVYSSPIELWLSDAATPNPELARALAAAQACGAGWLKVSLGHYRSEADFKALNALLAGQPVHLLVENDQTPQGGCIEPMVQFFTAARVRGVDVGMTFDIGNWQWQAQSVLGAAAQLGQYVEYLHCKAVRLDNAGKLIAVAPGAHDYNLWSRVLRRIDPRVVRAIEYPLQSDDLAALTKAQVAALAALGAPEEVSAHV